MNKIFSGRSRIFNIFLAMGLAILGIHSMGLTIQAQTVSTWGIQKNMVIEGISTEPIGSDVYRTWFTEYNRDKIGRIITQPGLNAFLSEWKPDTLSEFHPFKITTGRYFYTVKKVPTIISVPPYSDYLSTDENFKVVPKHIEQSMKIRTFAAFTLPDEGKVGMLHQNIYGGADYFWLWQTSQAGLIEPWDIQRRSQSYKETDMWISNRTPQQALYQFMPLTNNLNVWSFASFMLDVRVFYVVPGLVNKNTEIWIGGRDTLHAVDYIAYMNVDKKNVIKAFYMWPLKGTRTMTSISYTQKPSTKTGFKNTQVWLTSSAIPEVTILEPNSIYLRGGIDYLCESSIQDSVDYRYNGANGAFWPSVLFPTSADNERRMLITGGQNAQLGGILTAVKGDAVENVQKMQAIPLVTTVQVTSEVQLALRSDKIIEPELEIVSTHSDSIACSTTRLIWDQAGGFDVDYSPIQLDIDINGRASADQSAPTGFNFDIIWHEQSSGKIGRMATGPVTSAAAISTEVIEGESMESFTLSQNYPNPFNPITTINYMLPKDALVTLIVYNSLGQEVKTLMKDELIEMGEQSVIFNSNNLASGVYYYRLSAQAISLDDDEEGNDVMNKGEKMILDVKKMILLK